LIDSYFSDSRINYNSNLFTLISKAMEKNSQQDEDKIQLEFNPQCCKIALIYLTTILEPKEIILEVVEASCNSTTGLLMATDSRLIFAGVSFIEKSLIIKISYKDISSIDILQDFMLSHKIIVTHPETTIFNVSPIDDAKGLLFKVNKILRKYMNYSMSYLR
jgi:hypothetical protein